MREINLIARIMLGLLDWLDYTLYSKISYNNHFSIFKSQFQDIIVTITKYTCYIMLNISFKFFINQNRGYSVLKTPAQIYMKKSMRILLGTCINVIHITESALLSDGF